MTTVNERIKQVRQYLKLSQAKFAKNLCLSSGYIAGIELEKRRANDRIVRLVSITYGVNEEWLKTGSGAMYDRVSNARIEQTMKIFRELKPEFQDHVLRLMENLIDLQDARTGSAPASEEQ